MTAFLDSNIVIAITNDGDKWHQWAVGTLQTIQSDGAAYICDMVYCELTMGLGSLLAVERVVETLGLQRVSNKDAALLGAGQAFLAYKAANKNVTKTSVLPDFLIGAMADYAKLPLATSNPKDFVKHFPNLSLIKP